MAIFCHLSHTCFPVTMNALVILWYLRIYHKQELPWCLHDLDYKAHCVHQASAVTFSIQ